MSKRSSRNYKVFLSHKQRFANEAEQLDAALQKGAPGATVFRSEDIDLGGDWRKEIDNRLDKAKRLVLLYTSPEQDWSWCFYEAGRFSRKGRQPRPVGCLHPKDVKPPSPLAHLQSIAATQDNIRRWLDGDFFRSIRTRDPSSQDLDEAVKAIEELVSGMPTEESFLKPYIWIKPKAPSDWKGKIDFTNALVEIDEISAKGLNFNHPPNLELLPFLRRIACDTTEQPDKIEFWITKFFESLQSAVDGKANFQEEAYFRHENGKTLRPVVVSFTRCATGSVCRLRVVFAQAFGTPLTDSPGLLQRLSIGARLAIRTRLEIVDAFSGRLSQIQKQKLQSRRDEDEIGRKIGIGSRLVEALNTIVQEAVSHGVRPEDDPPILFDAPVQDRFLEIRQRGVQTWNELERAAIRDDGTGDYAETERLLIELKKNNEGYLALVLPRIEELVVPAGK
ncbi:MULTISPECIES: toll/interleukin-1 receptor domain-containing protein [Bradyrhizobium]|jgi:hypothetical protein|uniref:toll/interleukin-1 receptor domain-containing protein n=1 Tax=Bradyrhizobium TaxID=374 RepID=UPI00040A9E6D|nr:MULTISPECIES: toll/interleukin-1 receptor domain-containing protein [Bradyrhizobium]AUC97768.1 toll/interleukin-1 receptor domain-containing protein [Bradyrhizobium sp. SK17]MBK5650618.1 toll/interleukin-1 receptor domain-containing protein [Rhizobium sp.]